MDPARDDCQSYEGDKQSAVTDLAAETVTVTGVEDSGSEVSAVDTACELSGYFDSPASNR